MKLVDDDLVNWILLRADHPDWSDEQIERELFARVAVGDERR